MDLKLLQVFNAVHSEGSVSRAADRLGLSQPAISHALRRLRLELKDPLFVRVPGGVAPTPKGERLASSVAHALAGLEKAIHEASHFDPPTSERTFRLYMTDIGELTFLPYIMEALQAQAPRLRVEVDQVALTQIMPALESGALDLAIGYLPRLSEVAQHTIVVERYVAVVGKHHPLANETREPSLLHRLDYAVVRSHSETRRQLERLQLEDRVRLTLPHFLVLPALLARTDLATLVPYRLARHFVEHDEAVILDGLFESSPLEVGLHWYWRMENDPGHRWLRELIIGLFDETGGGAAPPTGR